jgi:hypothetical protein
MFRKRIERSQGSRQYCCSTLNSDHANEAYSRR